MRKLTLLTLLFTLGAAAGASTVTIGPTGMYATPCAAFPNLADGDTVQIDANNGVPYMDTNDCVINNSNLTIVGVNGRPIIDGSAYGVSKGLWVVDGHDIVINNFEFRNASNIANGWSNYNASGLRIESSDGGFSNVPAGGNITVEHCYIHDNGDGILSGNADGVYESWYSANPFLLFEYDEFFNNGINDGGTHNIYAGFGGNMDFTLEYSWSHDAYGGHAVKTRAPHNNILYDQISDSYGSGDVLLDFCLGGTTYVVGDVVVKAATDPNYHNQSLMIYRDIYDSESPGAALDPPYQDLHFVNNTVVDDPSNTFPGFFVPIACTWTSTENCPNPQYGGPMVTAAVIENNLFVGPSGFSVSNQSSGFIENNAVLTNTQQTLAENFADAAHFDFHLVAGSPAIGAGIYPPTDNTGTADPLAMPQFEYLSGMGMTARPTPGSARMDQGAYSYPRSDTPPTPGLSYTQDVTVPSTGTITLSGLPAPAAGQHDVAVFISENLGVIPWIPSVENDSGTITTSFSTLPVVALTVVPIDIYVAGTHLTATVNVHPGPPVLYSVTQDGIYGGQAIVHLLGPSNTPLVVNLSSSNQAVLYSPATVTIPAGAINVEAGTFIGGPTLAGPSDTEMPATLTATLNGVTKTLSENWFIPGVHSFGCVNSPCDPVVGGSQYGVGFELAGTAPWGGANVQIVSSDPAAIPDQTYYFAPGGGSPPNGEIFLTTNIVQTVHTVTLQAIYGTDNWAYSGPITVNPGGEILAVNADSASRLYGVANPTFTGTITGQFPGDSFTESFATAATISSAPGTYAIVPSPVGPDQGAYTIVTTNGTLTISQAPSQLSLAASASQITPGSAVTLTATAVSTTSGTPTGSVSFSIGSQVLGTAPLNAQGVASLTVSTLGAGFDSITANYAGDTNFLGSQAQLTGGISVGVPGFNMFSGTTNLSIAPGQTGTTALTFSPSFGYAGPVSFSCTGLPAHSSCTFSPASVVFNGSGSPLQVMLTIAIGTSSAHMEMPRPLGTLPVLPAIFFWLPGTGATLDERRRSKETAPLRTRGLLLTLLLTVLAAGVLGLWGCGAVVSPGPAELNVNVVATGAGNVVQTVTLNISTQ